MSHTTVTPITTSANLTAEELEFVLVDMREECPEAFLKVTGLQAWWPQGMGGQKWTVAWAKWRAFIVTALDTGKVVFPVIVK